MPSDQNTLLPSAGLAAIERQTMKPTIFNDEWIDAPVIVSRPGGRLVERPAGGAANLLEAALRERAMRAYSAIFANGPPPEPISADAAVPERT